MLQATANHQCPICFLIANKSKYCQICPWNRWHKLHTKHLEKGGVSITTSLKYQETVETLNDVSLKFDKNHILPWRYYFSLFWVKGNVVYACVASSTSCSFLGVF